MGWEEDFRRRVNQRAQVARNLGVQGVPIEHNHTTRTRAEIEALPVIGRIAHNWRQRDITLYASDDPAMAFMVGVAFDNSMVVISYEEIGLNEKTAIDYWNHGNKTLVRD